MADYTPTDKAILDALARDCWDPTDAADILAQVRREAARDALRELYGPLTSIAASLIRASYDDDVERMASALGNGSLAVKDVVDRCADALEADHDH